MKRINIIFFAILLAFISCGCGNKVSTKSMYIIDSSESFETWTLAEGNASLKVGKYLMEVIAETGEVKVTDMVENIVFSSGAAIRENEEAAQAAEISISYYDSQSIGYTLNSRDNAFNTEIYQKQNSIRVRYHIRKDAIEYLVPKVFKTAVFEALCSKLESSEKNRLKRYYSHIKTDSKSSQIEALKEKYSYLKSHDLYIVYDNLMNDEKEAITNIMHKAGYTMDQYLEDAESMDIDSSKLDVTPSFTVTLEYTLYENGLEAKCLTDLIETGNSQFVLQEISILKGFGAANGGKPTFLLADGSGSLAKTIESEDEIFKAKVYGNNPVIVSDNTATLTQSYRLPIFGYSSDKGSFFAIITKAAEVARVCAQTKGSKNYYDLVYTSFDLQDMDRMSIRPGSNMFDVNYYSNKIVTQCPTILYRLGKPFMTDADFAEEYRAYLYDQNNKPSKLSGGALWLEFSGYTLEKTNVAGVPVEKKIILSTLDAIQKIVDELHEKGIENIYLRLKDFGNGGKKHGASNVFELEKQVGTEKQLKELADTLAKHNGKLFLENDVTYACSDKAFDSFSPRKDTCYTLSGGIAYDKQFDVVELNYENTLRPRYIVSPANYYSYFEKFAESINDKLRNSSLSLSWSSGGSTLVADYKKGSVINRMDTLLEVKNSFNYLDNSFGKSMTSGGNAYVLPFASAITDVPLYHSNLTIETDSSLFYQMTVHGLVEYAGESISTSLYPDELILRSVESGAALYYSLITEEDAYLQLNMSKDMSLVPPPANRLLEEIGETVRRINDFYKLKANFPIKSHTEISENVFKTEYENGLYSIVNYRNNDFVSDAGIVKAFDFSVSEVAE